MYRHLQNRLWQLSRNGYRQSLLLLAFILVLLAAANASDLFRHLPGFLVPLIVALGKGTGTLALLLGIAALIILPLKWRVPLLPLLHPMLGVTAVTAAAVHGYLLWSIPVAKIMAINSGIVTMGFLLLVAVTGMLIRTAPRVTGIKAIHKVATALLVLALIIHKVTA